MFIPLTKTPTPKAIILVPDNICHFGNELYLVSKFIQPVKMNVNEVVFVQIPTGKPKKEIITPLLKKIKEYCEIHGIKYIGVTSSDFYQHITKDKKFSLNIGKSKKGTIYKHGKIIIDFTDCYIIPILNPIVLNKFPNKKQEVFKGIDTLNTILKKGIECLTENTNTIIEKEVLIKDSENLIKVLKTLYKENKIIIDIETTGLKWYKDRLLTISMTNDGKTTYCIALHPKYHSQQTYNNFIKILKQFFTKYPGKYIGHNYVGFDMTFIVHEIIRKRDFSLKPYEIINNMHLEDTMFMAYLLYNSTERPSIGLKNLAYKYLGDWDADIDQKNLLNAPLEKIAHYNNLDIVATYKIYNDLQKEIKEQGFTETYKNWIQYGKQLLKLKMVGLRVDMPRIKRLSHSIGTLVKKDKEALLNYKEIQLTADYIAKETLIKKQKTLKQKTLTIEEVWKPFNPNSSNHKRYLFFELLDLPVLKRSSKTKEPSTDKDTIKFWLDNPDIEERKKDIINKINEIVLANKIKNTYLKNIITEAIEIAPNDYRIFANFNQTATITGRLSSSGVINMQTIPNSSKYGDEVKKLFIAPEGYFMGTIDYSALEDRLVANASKDENKCNIFLKKIDGHCLNAVAYYADELKSRGLTYDITDPKSVNKLKQEAGDLRQAGKTKTFALNYLAGAATIGQKEYDSYWKLYKQLHTFNNSIIKIATKQGYLISEYSGLRLILSSINAKDEAAQTKETRVAVNFVTQSGNILMLQSINEEQQLIEQEHKEEDILLCNTVHDSQYFYIKNDPNIIKFANDNFIKIMTKDYIEDQIVPLEAEMEIGNNMKETVRLKNKYSINEIKEVIKGLTCK